MIDLSKSRICITGAHGFLGGYIYKELMYKYDIEASAPSSLDYDLRKECGISDMFSDFQPDIIIHCAAHAGGIGLNQQKPAELFYDNAIMGIQLMHEAYKTGVKKYVQIGTICEYPKFTPTPFKEENLWDGYPEETNAPYGIAKKSLLVMGQAYRQQYGFNVIHLLPVNLYGPGDNFKEESSHVIPALIKKIIDAKRTNGTVEIWGTASATREFLYVEDAAKAIVAATEQYDGADPVNIGSGKEISISELAAWIAEIVDFDGPWGNDSSKPDGQPERRLDTSRAFKKFGFKATTKLKDGLRKTIDWYLKQLDSDIYSEEGTKLANIKGE
jgi:GDP-L-fucose synthase